MSQPEICRWPPEILPLVGNSPLPPAAGPLSEAHSLHTTSSTVKMEKAGVSETALLICPAAGSYMPHSGVRGGAFGRGTALQAGRLRARFPMG